jgi:hypothetical protein
VAYSSVLTRSRRKVYFFGALAGLIAIVALGSVGVRHKPGMQQLGPSPTEDDVIDLISRVIDEERKEGHARRAAYNGAADALGRSQWLPTTAEELDNKRVQLQNLQSSLHAWHTWTNEFPQRLTTRLTQLNVPHQVLDETVRGVQRGVDGSVAIFQARLAQIEAIRSAFDVMAASAWTMTDGGVRFELTEAQSLFDSSVAKVDQSEREIAALSAQLEAARRR